VIRFSFINILLLLNCAALNVNSYAATKDSTLKDVEIIQNQENRQRGAITYYHTCRLCHDLKYVRYQNLLEIGFEKKEIDEIRGQHDIDTPLMSTSSHEILTELFGMIPPDLSLMAKARKHGPAHIYSFLTSYHEDDAGNYNNAFLPGTKMPDALNYSIAMNENEKMQIEDIAKDLAAFLAWTSDPKSDERKSLGVYVIAYFILLSTLLYIIKQRVWRRLD